MSKITTIWEESKEAKLYLSARHDRDDELVLTSLLEDPDAESRDLLHPLASSRRRPQRRSALGACLEKEQHVTTEFSKSCKQLQNFLGALARREQDDASPRVRRISRDSSGYDSKAEAPKPRIGQLICQIEEAYKDPGATKRRALPERRGHRGDMQALKVALDVYQRAGYPQVPSGS